MAFENLSERERQVLEHLIEHYIQTADPVGSRVIANKYRMGISPATIRNTMQDLEELGLIQQPHTSAGRIPTDSGYRVFVDMLLQPEPLTKAEQDRIKNIIKQRRVKGLNALLSQTSKILGEITNQLGVTMAPKFDEGVLTRIDLIPVAEGHILMIVSVKGGLARSILLEVESEIEVKALRQVEQVLNERLAGLSMGKIRATLSDRLADTNLTPKLLKLFIDSDSEIWSGGQAELIHITGADNIISQPEFADREKLREFIKLLEEKKELQKLFEAQGSAEGIIITIGRENPLAEIQNCSLVTSTYKTENFSGTIGIIGPTRMPYSKLVSIVEYTARSLTEALSEM